MKRIAILLTSVVAFGVVSVPVSAQDQTLADIRQEMTVLYVEIQKLKRELSTTGGVSSSVTAGSPLERVDLIESELQRLTAKTEQLENRINRIVADGTNRIGDLEFRLVELEGGDISTLGETTTLGGNVETAVAVPQTEAGSGAQLAVGEQADFDRAKAALDAGEFQQAADQFAAFTQTYTSGPMTGAAHYHRGEALAGLSRTTDAARAFLESYSGSPNGPKAPDALFRLGTSLADLGQTNEACVTLGQVEILYPGNVSVGPAQDALASLGCL